MPLANNISFKSDSVLTEQGSSFAELNLFGDGNCAFYVASMAIAGLMRSNQMPEMSEDTFQKFLFLMRERINDLVTISEEYEKRGRAEVVPFIEQFSKNILQPQKVSYEDFKLYVKKQTSRAQIAAVGIAMAPGLRQIAYKAAKDIDALTEQNKNLHMNFVSADGTDLVRVCTFFDLDAQVYVLPNQQDQNAVKTNSVVRAKLLPATPLRAVSAGAAKRPVVVAIHRGHKDDPNSHFNLLVPHETLLTNDHVWHAIPGCASHQAAEKEIVKKHAKEIKEDVLKDLEKLVTSQDKEEKKCQESFDHLLAEKYNERYQQALEAARKNQENIMETDEEMFAEALVEVIAEVTAQENNEFAKTMHTLSFFRHHVRHAEEVEMEVEHHAASAEKDNAVKSVASAEVQVDTDVAMEAESMAAEEDSTALRV